MVMAPLWLGDGIGDARGDMDDCCLAFADPAENRGTLA